MFGFILPDWVSEKMLKTFIFGLLVLVSMLFIYLLVINPKFGEIKALESKLSADNKALASLKQSRDGINKLKESLNESQQVKVLSAIPLSYSPERVIYVLRELASQTGVSVVSYSLPSGVLFDDKTVEQTSKKGEMVSFTTSPVKVTIAAPVDVLLKFISKLETSLPFGIVSDLNLQEITKLTKDGNNKDVQITLEIKYYQANLNKININDITSFTESNIDLANTIEGYSMLAIPDDLPLATNSSQTASNSGNLFGF